jgi:hypothetical protein
MGKQSDAALSASQPIPENSKVSLEVSLVVPLPQHFTLRMLLSAVAKKQRFNTG